MSATDATFQAPIPGSSLTHEMGSLPHEKPPKYTDPNEALEYFWKLLSKPDTMQQIWQIARNGGTVWAITKAILFKACLMGIIQMNLGVTIAQTVSMMIITIIKSRGIAVKLHPKFKNKLRDDMIKEKMKELLSQYGMNPNNIPAPTPDEAAPPSPAPQQPGQQPAPAAQEAAQPPQAGGQPPAQPQGQGLMSMAQPQAGAQ